MLCGLCYVEDLVYFEVQISRLDWLVPAETSHWDWSDQTDVLPSRKFIHCPRMNSPCIIAVFLSWFVISLSALCLACLSVCCLSGWLFVHVPLCLLGNLPACSPRIVSAWLPTCLRASLWLPASHLVSLVVCIPIFLTACWTVPLQGLLRLCV